MNKLLEENVHCSSFKKYHNRQPSLSATIFSLTSCQLPYKAHDSIFNYIRFILRNKKRNETIDFPRDVMLIEKGLTIKMRPDANNRLSQREILQKATGIRTRLAAASKEEIQRIKYHDESLIDASSNMTKSSRSANDDADFLKKKTFSCSRTSKYNHQHQQQH